VLGGFLAPAMMIQIPMLKMRRMMRVIIVKEKTKVLLLNQLQILLRFIRYAR
jgi:hypothetical protein